MPSVPVVMSVCQRPQCGPVNLVAAFEGRCQVGIVGPVSDGEVGAVVLVLALQARGLDFSVPCGRGLCTTRGARCRYSFFGRAVTYAVFTVCSAQSGSPKTMRVAGSRQPRHVGASQVQNPDQPT